MARSTLSLFLHANTGFWTGNQLSEPFMGLSQNLTKTFMLFELSKPQIRRGCHSIEPYQETWQLSCLGITKTQADAQRIGRMRKPGGAEWLPVNFAALSVAVITD
jgi:hypothetical protein